jgi:hypothetical protein
MRAASRDWRWTPCAFARTFASKVFQHGKTIAASEVRLRVFDEITRREAPLAPVTARNSRLVPSVIERIWGHDDGGDYAKAARGGVLEPGDKIRSLR